MLVVDDSAAFRARLVVQLREAAFDVVGEAEGIGEAVTLTRELMPDAIVLDLHLADGNGVDILPTLRKTAPAACILVLTGTPYPQLRQHCLAIGADFFLDKSTEADQVAVLLARPRGAAAC